MHTSMRRGDGKAAFWMLLPFALFFTAFVVYPLAANIYYSFTNYRFGSIGDTEFVGFANYVRLFNDRGFTISLRNTFVYAFFSIILLSVAGLFFALASNRSSRIFKTARSVFIAPYAVSFVAASLIWLMLLDPGLGAVNKILIAFGVDRPPSWLFDADLALPSLIAINVWKNAGYVMLLFLAGLQNVSPDLYDAAKIDGANLFQKIRNVTLPAISPVTVFVLVTVCIESFKTFEQVKIITRGGPMLRTSTVVYQIYLRAFEDFQMSYAAAQSVALLVIILLVTLANFKAVTKRGAEG